MGDPGRDRYLSYAPPRTGHAWVLRHRDRCESRPWLVCIHGYQMGAPAIDLELFGGWRWNRDSLRLEFENVTHPSGPSGPQSGRAVFTEDTWELGVRWLPSERHTLYLKHAKGYKAGNLEADNQTGVIRSADPELIRAWELGLKSSLADDRVHPLFFDQPARGLGRDLRIGAAVGEDQLDRLAENAAAAVDIASRQFGAALRCRAMFRQGAGEVEDQAETQDRFRLRNRAVGRNGGSRKERRQTGWQGQRS